MNDLENQFHNSKTTFSKKFLDEFTMFEKNNHYKKIYNRHFTGGQKWLVFYLPKIIYIILPLSYLVIMAKLNKDLLGTIFLIVILALMVALVIVMKKFFKAKGELYNRQVYNRLYARYFDFNDYSEVNIKDIRKNNINVLLDKHNLKKEVGTYNKLHYILSNLKSRSVNSVQTLSIVAIMMITAIVTMYVESRFHAFMLILDEGEMAKQITAAHGEGMFITTFIIAIIFLFAAIFYLLYLLIKMCIILINFSTSKKNRHITLNALEQLIVEQLRY